MQNFFSESSFTATSRYRKLGSPACDLFIGLQLSDVVHIGLIDLSLFEEDTHYCRPRYLFVHSSSVGRKTECCLRYITETVGPTELRNELHQYI